MEAEASASPEERFAGPIAHSLAPTVLAAFAALEEGAVALRQQLGHAIPAMRELPQRLGGKIGIRNFRAVVLGTSRAEYQTVMRPHGEA